MGLSIAVAGKGGSGKTTISSLLIRYLINHGMVPVLAVDADANANLGESLGLTPRQTVGSVLASFQNNKINIPPGFTKEAYLEYKLNEALVEGKNLDLLTMGRGEGKECYCYPNLVLRKFVDNLADNYACVVIDNEAGMEHMSRGTTRDIDYLFIVSAPNVKGIRTVARIQELAKELNLVIRRQYVIINYVRGELEPAVSAEMVKTGIQPAALIPHDDTIIHYDLQLMSLLELPETAPAVKAMNDLLQNILGNKS